MLDCSSLFYYIIYCFFSGKENAAFDVIIKPQLFWELSLFSLSFRTLQEENKNT